MTNDKMRRKKRLDSAEGKARHPKPEPRESWHEDDGNVLWWAFPITEPPYVGSPLDEDFPGYLTHWTRIVLPEEPR